MAQDITIALVGTLIDDENFPANDQTTAVRRSDRTSLTLRDGEVELLNSDDTAGGEVRLNTTVTAKLLSDGKTARVAVLFRMFEGTSADTTDPEGADVAYARNVSSNSSLQFDVAHPGDGGGSFRGVFHVTNRTAK